MEVPNQVPNQVPNKVPNGSRPRRFSTVLLVAVIVVCLAAGGLIGYSISNIATQGRINDLQNELSTLPNQNVTYFLGNNVSLSQLYDQVKASVVVVEDEQPESSVFGTYYSQVQGSGFIYNYTGQMVIVTNYHVVENAINVTATFSDGNTYPASVLGYDPYEDLAVLSANPSQSEWKPLAITSSSTLEVGDPVVAVGSPYELAGTMTVGIVSALGRTLSESETGGYPIASIIQTSTAINPGNSGGPLLNYEGKVVGITTAIVSNSQGLGFAIPSNAIIRETESLITTGEYNQHPALGISGVDMSYDIAQAMHTNYTYGFLIESVSQGSSLQGGTNQKTIDGSQVTIGGDIIIKINQTRIANLDALSSYLEENTLPGQTVNVTVVRSNQAAPIMVSVKLGTRPSAYST